MRDALKLTSGHLFPYVVSQGIRRNALAEASAGLHSKACFSRCPVLQWSLFGTWYPAQSSCFCALGSSVVHRGQKKLCWFPLEEAAGSSLVY